MVAVKSFHAEKCCCMVNEHKSSAGVYAAVSISS